MMPASWRVHLRQPLASLLPEDEQAKLGDVISVGEACTMFESLAPGILPAITRLRIEVREHLALACAHASMREVWREIHACV